ncbi:MAG: hypothetical protein ACRC6T_07715 [Sarcina sp.]
MFLYHAVRQDMIGKKIVPLGSLYKTSEELCMGDISKFSNQYRRKNQQVDMLNCFKKDVIFMTAIPPDILNQELKRRTGYSFEGNSFYKIDLNKLDKKKLCLYLSFDPEDDAEFFSLDDEALNNFEEYTKYSEDAKDYWANIVMNSKEVRSLLFAGTYLFLHKGEIDISDCEIIEM